MKWKLKNISKVSFADTESIILRLKLKNGADIRVCRFYFIEILHNNTILLCCMRLCNNTILLESQAPVDTVKRVMKVWGGGGDALGEVNGGWRRTYVILSMKDFLKRIDWENEKNERKIYTLAQT